MCFLSFSMFLSIALFRAGLKRLSISLETIMEEPCLPCDPKLRPQSQHQSQPQTHRPQPDDFDSQYWSHWNQSSESEWGQWIEIDKN